MNPRSGFQFVGYHFTDSLKDSIYAKLGHSEMTDRFINEAESLCRYWHAVKSVDKHEPATAAKEIEENRRFIDKAEILLQVCDGLSVTTASLIAQQHCMINPEQRTGHSLHDLVDCLRDFIDAAEANVSDRSQYKTKGGPPAETARHEFLKALIVIYKDVFGDFPSYSRHTTDKRNSVGVPAVSFRYVAQELCQDLQFRSGVLEDALGEAMRDCQTSK